MHIIYEEKNVYRFTFLTIMLISLLSFSFRHSVKAEEAEDIPEISTMIITENGKQYLNVDGNRCQYMNSVEEAADYVRDGIIRHESKISLCLGMQEKINEVTLWDNVNTAIYKRSKIDPDYIELLLTGEQIRTVDTETVIKNDDQRVFVYYYEYQPEYYTLVDKEQDINQEKDIDNKVDSIISDLSLNKKNEYTKTKLIYQKLCNSVNYDWDFEQAAFSPYGALVKNKAVCQGIAMAFYRLGRQAGLDVGIVCGTGDDGDGSIEHAWNRVKIEGKYYFVDPTFDCEREKGSPFSYFLKGESEFKKDHNWNSGKYKVNLSNYSIPVEDRLAFDSNYHPRVMKISLSSKTVPCKAGKTDRIAPGVKVQLKADVTAQYGANKDLVWTTSNSKYATVSQKGKVTVKKKGIGRKVSITAKAKDGSGKKAVWKFKIVKGKVKKITILGKKKIKAGKKLKLIAKINATKGANKKIAWKSANTEYATVNAKGIVKTKSAGKGKKVMISAMATDGSKKKNSFTIKIK